MQRGQIDPTFWKLESYIPLEHQDRSFDENISKVSGRFVNIYRQAARAESDGLDELCGPGYRKALEFLIKDYVKTLPENSGKGAVIERAQLGTCIREFVMDANVKLCAQRASWLGNDETHYIRKWPAKDLEDLKKLIELTLHWISADILTRELEESMPDPKSA
jgi:hypothetical protein